MPYSTNVPNPGESPGLFPAQAQENFTRLKAIIGANHKFNDSTATDDGYHQLVKMLPVAVANVPNDSTVGQLFANSNTTNNELTYKDTDNVLWTITGTSPLRVAVNFGWDGVAVTIRSSINVDTITKEPSVAYGSTFKVKFKNSLPSNNYYATFGAMMPGSPPGFAAYVGIDAGAGTILYNDACTVNEIYINTQYAGIFQCVNMLIYGG